MKTAYIFGAGIYGIELFKKSDYKILGFCDNNSKLHNTELEGLPVIDPSTLSNLQFDKIVIASIAGFNTIFDQLIKIGVPVEKIDYSFVDQTIIKARINFLKELYELNFKNCDDNICVAEAGVFEGEFAKEINKLFAKNKLYLYDTFEGFDKRDFLAGEKEKQENYVEGKFGATSEKQVMEKMQNPDNVIIKKGYFPQTTKDVNQDLKYAFVNLDMDLYLPTLNGLEYFYPKMVSGGVILVHDYFSKQFTGVKKAVQEFKTKNDIKLMPIGDTLSIAILF